MQKLNYLRIAFVRVPIRVFSKYTLSILLKPIELFSGPYNGVHGASAPLLVPSNTQMPTQILNQKPDLQPDPRVQSQGLLRASSPKPETRLTTTCTGPVGFGRDSRIAVVVVVVQK